MWADSLGRALTVPTSGFREPLVLNAANGLFHRSFLSVPGDDELLGRQAFPWGSVTLNEVRFKVGGRSSAPDSHENVGCEVGAQVQLTRGHVRMKTTHLTNRQSEILRLDRQVSNRLPEVVLSKLLRRTVGTHPLDEAQHENGRTRCPDLIALVDASDQPCVHVATASAHDEPSRLPVLGGRRPASCLEHRLQLGVGHLVVRYEGPGTPPPCEKVVDRDRRVGAAIRQREASGPHTTTFLRHPARSA